MPTNTPPNAQGLANFKRVMVTRFGGTCNWCGVGTTAGVDFAALGADGKWIASCGSCSVSMSAMILGVCKRIGAVQDSLTPEQEATVSMHPDLLAAIDGKLANAEMIQVLAATWATWKTVEAFTATKVGFISEGADVLTGRVYTVNGVHYRIKESKTGNQYAMRFVHNGEGRKGSWDYDRGAITTVRRSGTLMTAADAAALGHSTHHCVFCSLELTDDRSTVVGYGPICAGKHGLPWG